MFLIQMSYTEQTHLTQMVCVLLYLTCTVQCRLGVKWS